jgi:hypothetical protein
VLVTHHAVPLSPTHAVTVDDDYWALIQRAPQQDFVVRTLAKRMAGDMMLMSGELVIAGRATREQFPLTAQYPLHFRKTYYPGQLRGDPKGEFERHTLASDVLGIPPALGWTPATFRSCLIPGKPFDTVLPFGSEPEESNIQHADKLSLATAAGLWLLSEQMLDTLSKLHRAGLTHGDAELHNFIVCSAPLAVVPIDFDMALQRADVDDQEWERRCKEELEPLLKVGVFLQCALGAQSGALAELSRRRMAELFQRPLAFERAIEERSGLLTQTRR